MIVNKSMFPLQTGFGVISKMQDRFATLQMQLGTGEKASKLSEMARDLPMSLSVRSRLGRIEGFSANIDTVNLRLSFLDKTLSRFDAIEGEARNSAIQGQYGTNNINMATLPGLSYARLDEMVTLLNSDIAGRYLFGGSNTDKAPLPTTDVLMNGQAGKAGFNAVASERKLADAGLSGMGRLETGIDILTPNIVTLSEDGVHPFGFKVSTVSTTSGAVSVTQPGPGTAPQGQQISVTFDTAGDQIQEGRTISIGLTMPDGTQTQVVMKAVTAENAGGTSNEFIIGQDADETAANFQAALEKRLKEVTKTDLAGASTFTAAANYFNGPGEPVLRVDGDPATATALRVGTEADTVMWYSGQTPAVVAANLGRLDISTTAVTDPLTNVVTHGVTIAQQQPVSGQYGFSVSAQPSQPGANITVTPVAGSPASVSVQLAAMLTAGESVEITLTEPNGTQRKVTLTAVNGPARAGQFSIGADEAATAQNFAQALTTAVTEASIIAEGNPRQSVSAQVDDTTRVNYGLQANESGFLRLVRTMASMSIESYPTEENVRASREPLRLAAMQLPEGGPREAALADYEAAVLADMREAMGRFDAMAIRQQAEMSEAHNPERGSIEIIAMEMGVALSTLNNAATRHTNYKAQLDNLLSDIETVNKEDVAMEILALQTRLQASYQATSMVSKLSIVNFL
ncbi:hypothetical protein [Devosia sp.]|uniref:hypothetical protein n=1 Tax=Devosia sp. TaxID=1871048 RepID=UPI002AFEE6E0|nr:hypothetical protein [Devosia sp.]